MMEKLPVIFRAEKSGDVTAVFPTVPAGRGYFTVYAHIGQHSGGSYGWYSQTRAAKPEEYADLLAELQRIYSRPDDPDAVGLVVYRRMTPQHRQALRRA